MSANIASRRNGQTAIVAPFVAIVAIFNQLGMQPYLFGPRGLHPFGDNFRQASKRKARIVAFITALLFFRSPANIARFIVAVGINSVYRMILAGPSAEAGEPFLKRCEPKLNTATAIQRVTNIKGVVAASFGSLKRAQLWTAFVSNAFTVGFLFFARGFSFQTPARARSASFKIISGCIQLLTAITFAQPDAFGAFGVFGNPSYKCLNQQPTKSLPGQVFEIVIIWFMGLEEYLRLGYRHFDLQYRLICLGLRRLFTQSLRPSLFYHSLSVKAFIFCALVVVCAVTARAQCTTQPGYICIDQASANKAAELVDRLKAANDLTASQAALITALQTEIKDLKAANAAWASKDAINEQINVTKDRLLAIRDQMDKLLTDIVERQQKLLTGGKTKTQRFLDFAKIVYYVLSGAVVVARL